MTKEKEQNAPKETLLKDYKKPDYLIDTVDLTFDLNEETTRVHSSMNIKSNHDNDGKVKPLFLDGEDLELASIKIDGRNLKPEEYKVEDNGLTILNPPKNFNLEIETDIHPKDNTELSGLYMSGGAFVTHNEPQGFRRITYFQDRPDVMAKYSTAIIADKDKFPVLLSNGNPIEEKEMEDGRMYSKWEDPFPKPSYLFAMVAGDLGHIKDNFKTASGRDVALKIYCEHGKENKCLYAMDSLKRSMKWDEEKFGREYDLDLFNVVAVPDFNAGAMENKGLNIFNDKALLADKDSANDSDHAYVERVLAHEYFHNWTGDRITCRDWFNLTLKEGLTVYRDQEFSSDMRSRPVRRIGDVAGLRAAQFPEDAGPLAHSARPESYISIRNFYTSTVYKKGAEIIRMQEKLLGKDAFKKGMDLYFDRHDGQAVTVDDFVKSMEDASGKDLSQLKRWYSQAGTPEVTAKGKYDAKTKTYELTLSQKCKKTPGQSRKEPFVIPLEMGLLDSKGNDMSLQLEGENKGKAKTSRMLELNETKQTFKFENVEEAPVLSVNRSFSAPVNMKVKYSNKEYAHLMSNDSDLFNRWDAGQQYATKELLGMVKDIQKGKEPKANAEFIKAFGSCLKDENLDIAFAAKAMALPTESYLALQMKVVDVDAIHEARDVMRTAIAEQFKDDLLKAHKNNQVKEAYSPDGSQPDKRALKNTALSYLSKLDSKETSKLVVEQYYSAENMTDSEMALGIIANSDKPERQEVLDDFYEVNKGNPLVIDKWLTTQATSTRTGTLDKVKELLNHEAYSETNPNKVRALVGAFSSNPTHFHAKDGSGYEFLTDQILKLDDINAQTTAKLVSPLGKWRDFDAERQEMMKTQLKRIIDKPGISSTTYEMAFKCLGEDDKKDNVKEIRHNKAKARIASIKKRKQTDTKLASAVKQKVSVSR